MKTVRWKLCWMFFLCAAAASVSPAQVKLQSSAPPIEILGLKWEKQVRLPRNFDPSVIPTGPAFSDPSRSAVTTTAPTAGSAVSDATRAAARARSEAAGSSVAFPQTPGRLPVFYVYALKIRNSGAKVIEGVAWDYLSLDPKDNAELGIHSFASYARVPTNKGVTLKGQLRSPPTRVVRTSNSDGNAHAKFIERAVIQCVLYADDTVWRNPNGRDGVCETLKNSKGHAKR